MPACSPDEYSIILKTPLLTTEDDDTGAEKPGGIVDAAMNERRVRKNSDPY